MPRAPDNDILDICWDIVFKAVFTRNSPGSKTALKQLLAAFIGYPVFAALVLNNEPPPAAVTDRQIRFDIQVRFNQEELADIGMSRYPRDFEPLRLEYYTARLFSSRNIQGQTKTFRNLTKTRQITFIRGRVLYADPAPVHRFEYDDQKHQLPMGGKTHITVVELEKAKGLLKKPVPEMSVEERWIVFFRYLSDGTQGELLKELIHEEEGIAIARAEVVKISRNEAERAWLESQYKYELDRQSDLVSARRKGRAEGERLGLKKGLRETARSLQAMGLSPEQIAAATGLRPEELP